MGNLVLYVPVKPKWITQSFGMRPEVYSQFGINGHNGIDMYADHGQPVHAAHDGTARYEIDSNQGHGVVIISDDTFSYNGSECYYKTIYWHLCDPVKEPLLMSPVPNDGKGHAVKAGDVIGFADNTGFSTGNHLHFGLKPVMQGEDPGTWYNTEQNNGFAGAIDPEPYLSPVFAEDIKQQISLYRSLIAALQAIISILKK